VGFAEILTIALALALDALAVALVTGLRRRCSAIQTLRMALAFGGFQFFMPVLGWGLGVSVRSYIESFDHWVAFALLAFAGGKMILESWKNGEAPQADPTRGATLLLLALATSLDALAVGVSLAMLKVWIWYPAAIIGLVCFVLTVLGLRLGGLVPGLNPAWSRRAGGFGGLALLGIGVKILLEHGVFA
jgi:putative Mn2+ efflux pump MntP